MGRVSAELGRRIYLDANIFIYAVEGFAAHAASIQALLAAMDAGEVVAVTSDLTVAEVLVKPLKDQNQAVQQAYKTFLLPTAALEVIAISRELLEEAAHVRATTKLKLPDAIHFATALRQQCDSFLTNDELFKSVGSPKIKILSELTLD